MDACESTLNDFQLLERSSTNECYFTMLYKRYYDWLYALFMGRTGDRDSACSMCNDIWIKVWSDRKAILKSKGENDNLKGYLYVKATSHMVDYMRARKKARTVFSLDDEKALSQIENLLAESDGLTANNAIEKKSTLDYWRRLLTCIEKDKDNRQLYWKIRVEGYSIQEMAKIVSQPESTIRSKLYRIALKLRALRSQIDLGLLFLCFSLLF